MNTKSKSFLFLLPMLSFLVSPIELVEVRKMAVVGEEVCHDYVDRNECVIEHCVRKTINTVRDGINLTKVVEEKNIYWTAKQVLDEDKYPISNSHLKEIVEKGSVLFHFGEPDNYFAMDTMFTYIPREKGEGVFKIRDVSILPVGTPVCKRPEGLD